MNWRISVADGLAEAGLELLRSQAEVLDDPRLAALGSVEALIVRSRTRVTAEVLSAGRPRLAVVGRAGVGLDNIDTSAAEALGIAVVNAPESVSDSVAEHALALLMALAREIPRADSGLKQGRWEKKDLQGTEVAGKTLGLIGVGRIGSALARRAGALGMKVLGYDPLIPAESLRRAGAEPVELARLYAEADFVSLHMPLAEETRAMVGRAAFSQMKPGARLINVARGGVVDQEALLEALDSGRLAGAALDVFAEEPPGRTRLVAHPKVVATPHIAAQTAEAQARAARQVAEAVLAVLARARPVSA